MEADHPPRVFVIGIWPLSGYKLFSCDVEPGAQVGLRSFRRGTWENRFLSYADPLVM